MNELELPGEIVHAIDMGGHGGQVLGDGTTFKACPFERKRAYDQINQVMTRGWRTTSISDLRAKCQKLGAGWDSVSIKSAQDIRDIVAVLKMRHLDYWWRGNNGMIPIAYVASVIGIQAR